jgi:peroxin-1
VELIQAYGCHFPILCTANSSDVNLPIHATLSQEKLFSITFELFGPDQQTRRTILETWNNEHNMHNQQAPSFAMAIPECVAMMDGYHISDMLAVLQTALLHFTSTVSTDKLFVDALRKEMATFVPSHLRNCRVRKITHMRFADIGGMHHVKRELTELIDWPNRYAKLFRLNKLRWGSGLLLYGPPGCGKTLIVQTIAAECGLNYFSVKGPELLNKYIGASEQAVRDLFLRARMALPSILFFDEFDAIAPQRGHDHTGVTDRVVNQLLTELDGVESLQGVFVLAATARPDLLDGALLRPGRLDKSLFCDFPNREDRIDILRILCRNLNCIEEEACFDWLADQTHYYSGADLEALVSDSQLEAIHDALLLSKNSHHMEHDVDNELDYLYDSGEDVGLYF